VRAKKNSNLDVNLKNLVFNTKEIDIILSKHGIEKIYFTSRFVEKIFKSKFKDIILKFPKVEFVTLPSPSPRYARMKIAEKITKYKELLPNLRDLHLQGGI